MHSVSGRWADVLYLGHSGQDGGGQHRARRDGPLPVLAQMSPQLPFYGNARLPDHPLAGVDGDGLPHQVAGAGQDWASTDLMPRAISDAQGWCRVMAYIESVLV